MLKKYIQNRYVRNITCQFRTTKILFKYIGDNSTHLKRKNKGGLRMGRIQNVKQNGYGKHLNTYNNKGKKVGPKNLKELKKQRAATQKAKVQTPQVHTPTATPAATNVFEEAKILHPQSNIPAAEIVTGEAVEQGVKKAASEGVEQTTKKPGLFTRLGNKIKGIFTGKGSAKATEEVAGKTAEKAAEQTGKAAVEQGVEQAAKKPWVLSKIGNFFKGKGGKAALIGLGIAALVAGGAYVYSKMKGDKTEGAPQDVAAPDKAQQNPAAKTDPITKPETKPGAKAETDPAQQEQKPAEAETDAYTVEKGDNLWNIAKHQLIEEHQGTADYKPTNKEILEKTEELMKLNNKDYEKPLPSDSRKRRVMIHVGDKLQLNA